LALRNVSVGSGAWMRAIFHSKVFLLERFFARILFESSTPNLLEFVVTESAMMPSP
jgi:hypothetical protein